MRLNTVQLGELASVIGGYAFKSRDFVDQGVPVIKIANVTWTGVDLKGSLFLPEEFLTVKDNFHVNHGDVLISLTGSQMSQPNSVVGRVARYNHDNTALLNQRVGKLIPNDSRKCHIRFIYYYLRQDAVTYQLASNAKGSANQANISSKDVERLHIPAFPIEQQQRIADILSAYDDLIENNRRRIQLLEQAARLLYKEWFVHLRFPGHEHVTITDGVPKGWEKRSLEKCVSVLETGNRPKGGVSGIEEGIPSIGAESIIGAGQFDFSKTKYVPESYFWKLKKGVVQNRDVLIYKDGGRPGHFTPHISFFGDGFPFKQMALNSHVYRIRGTSDVSQEFLYYHLSSGPMMSWMNKAGSGAAIPGIARKDLLRLPVIVPSPRVLEMFTEVAANGLTQILSLALAAKKICDARNLLLPRLMNGEVAV